MSEPKTEAVEPEEPNGQEPTEPQTEPTDYEAMYKEAIKHSREWEKRAKANKGAADELAELKRSQMSEIERAQAERDELKAQVDAFKAKEERAAWIAEVAKETKVDAGLLEMLSASTKDELLEKAQTIAEKYQERADEPAGTVPVVLGDGNHAKEVPSVSANDFIRAQFKKMNH